MREGAGAVAIVTVAKLLPLLLFLVASEFSSFNRRTSVGRLAGKQGAGRYRLASDVRLRGNRSRADSERRSEESRAHRSTIDLSRALSLTTAIYILIQLVAQGTLGADWQISTTHRWPKQPRRFSATLAAPFFSPARPFPRSVLLRAISSVRRACFSPSAEMACLPAWFARVHPRYRLARCRHRHLHAQSPCLVASASHSNARRSSRTSLSSCSICFAAPPRGSLIRRDVRD